MPAPDPRITNNIEVALRIGALFAVIYLVARIVAPFLSVILWAVIVAVAVFPAFRWLRDRFGGRDGAAAAVLSVAMLLLLIVPAAWLGTEAMGWSSGLVEQMRDGTLRVPPPPAKVAGWPIVGERVHAAWTLASTNLSQAILQAEAPLRALATWLLDTAAGVGVGVLQFALSIAIAGALLARSQDAGAFVRRLFARIMPGSTTDFALLSERTIRSVATGVIGVALIQAALIGVALIAIGVPGAPIWILAVVLLGIVQLPASLVTLPLLVWVWGSQETLPAALFTAWIVPAGLADNVLKPLLLGRGVEAPMLVIFMGAIGGFIYAGIVGLFTGAVILVLAFKLFEAWLGDETAPVSPPPPESMEPS